MVWRVALRIEPSAPRSDPFNLRLGGVLEELVQRQMSGPYRRRQCLGARGSRTITAAIWLRAVGSGCLLKMGWGDNGLAICGERLDESLIV